MAKLYTVSSQLQRIVFDVEKVVGWKLLTQAEVLEVYCAGIPTITVGGHQAIETEKFLSATLTSVGQAG